MSGIVGSLNTRGSGLINLGSATDGQLFTGTGAGLPVGFETAAGGGKVAQIVSEPHVAYLTGTTVIPADDSIPTSSEGTEVLTKAITPTSATNRLFFTFTGNLHNSSTQNMAFTLFQDSGSAAIAMGWTMAKENAWQSSISFTHDMLADTTSSTTFKIRMGGEGGTYRTSGSASARRYGGLSANRLTIIEYTP